MNLRSQLLYENKSYEGKAADKEWITTFIFLVSYKHFKALYFAGFYF